ncbi:hypothetical protein [Solitalea lacus]|uniref:hypothetical protein n=1 Tax=Solitalea lacus TaxID=2911172 RepID=UPI001EDA9AB9|nr:hypothetical protein [Solitalea lacus]UKJ06988.1 hypothetical protein L2B55_15840 [Solitalea lacus]
MNLRAEDYKTEMLEVKGILLNITSYKIGDEYHCLIANADPGANISRATAESGEEARRIALEKATERLNKK